ncbi:helix-turn-helix transcriptional regulator [Frateuria defendens]|uniref:helix-turn-helix transcriptional regulator n=1 Tax=Frateuria defendens TaxID=2219559 RepID=UPI00066FF4AA|nr:helix-turn-helix transcriptional regulator [Frateuria defendens]
MPLTDNNPLGSFLKDRRARLDPAAFGFPAMHRRTPGLRREEVAQRANVSTTWYTWLEQGRGGAPSTEVLERLARALALTAVEREHLFLLAQRRPPEIRYHAPAGVSVRLQRILDALEYSPAYVKNAAWDVVAWNRAAAAVLTDYATLEAGRRNILRLVFGNPRLREEMPNWDEVARSMVAVLRADTTRAGMPDYAMALIEELGQSSPEFAAMWLDQDVLRHGEGSKLIRHAQAGPIALDYSAFAIDGQPDLGLVIYTPASDADAERVKALIAGQR